MTGRTSGPSRRLRRTCLLLLGAAAFAAYAAIVGAAVAASAGPRW